MSNENFNCYEFFADSEASPDGRFEKGTLRKYLSEEMPAYKESTVFQGTLKEAAQNFLRWLEESIECQKKLKDRKIASALTVELQGHASHDGTVGSASFGVKYKGESLPDLVCKIQKERLPGSYATLMQEVAIGSRRMERFDSAEGAIFWYIECVREMQRAPR